MKIDPCPCVVSLKNGSNHTLFKFRDFLDLVDQEMGMDAAKWLETHVNQLEAAADYTTAKIETDLTGYEASLDSNKTAFMDIQDQAETIMAVLQEKRISQAAYLLKNTRMRVDQVAEAVGYSNLRYFHQLFRARYGFSPKRYRDSFQALSR